MPMQWGGYSGEALNCGNSIANVAIAIYGRVISSLMYTLYITRILYIYREPRMASLKL